MRSIRWLAAVTVTLALGTACGGGGSGVTPPPDNTPPVASFTAACPASTCTFTNTSSDPDGTFTSSWNFGDGSPAVTDLSPTHTYTGLNAVTPFTVVLTITDNGGLTATANQAVTITPEAALNCVTTIGAADTTVDCAMDINQKAIVTVTLQSTLCKFVNNTFVMPSPAATPADTLFKNGCYTATAGTVYTINGPNPDKSFNAPTSVRAQFIPGHRANPLNEPPTGSPAAKVSGSFPDWTIALDDGGNVGGVGEPNFTDIVLTVHAAAVP